MNNFDHWTIVLVYDDIVFANNRCKFTQKIFHPAYLNKSIHLFTYGVLIPHLYCIVT